MPLGSMPAKAWRHRGGADGVHGHLDVPVGAVLETDRHRQAGPELAVDLALGGACADRPPRDGVGDVLRRDRVEELAADRQAGVEHPQQHAPREMQSGVDVARAVEVRIVDQALPAGRRARLLEVDAHRDQQLAAQGARQPPERAAYSSVASGRARCRARRRPAAGRRSPRAPSGRRARPRDDDVRLLARRAAAPRAGARARAAGRPARSACRGRSRPGRSSAPGSSDKDRLPAPCASALPASAAARAHRERVLARSPRRRSACGPSQIASSGFGWTSTMIPSAPTAAAASDSGVTRSAAPRRGSGRRSPAGA